MTNQLLTIYLIIAIYVVLANIIYLSDINWPDKRYPALTIVNRKMIELFKIKKWISKLV